MFSNPASLIRYAVLVSVAMHVVAVLASGQNAIVDPISRLGQSSTAWLFWLSLVAFAVAQTALRYHLQLLGHLFLHRTLGFLCLVAGAILLCLPIAFALVDMSLATVCLSVLASLVALAMGLLIPSLIRRSSAIHWLNVGLLCAWVILIPIGLWLDPDYIGAYQRFVGVQYAVWLYALSVLKPPVNPQGPRTDLNQAVEYRH